MRRTMRPGTMQYLGSCGAHLVGLNVRASPWRLDGRPANEAAYAHWEGLKPIVAARIVRPR
jgi:hypothetical protein